MVERPRRGLDPDKPIIDPKPPDLGLPGRPDLPDVPDVPEPPALEAVPLPAHPRDPNTILGGGIEGAKP